MRPNFMLAALAGLLLAAPALAQETPTPITNSEYTAAAGGEVLVETERGDINRGQVIGWLALPVADVAAIVADSDSHDQWFPDTRESTRISGTSNTSVSEGRTHVPIVRDRYWRLNGSHSQTSFSGIQCELFEYAYDDTYEDGNMEELYGYWLLCPYNDGTTIKYVINADLGIWLPSGIITWAQRRMLPGIITGIAERHAATH